MGKPGSLNRLSSISEYIGYEKGTWRTETSKYPQEKKSIEILLVAASESGTALKLYIGQWNGLERPVVEGDSPVHEN